MIVTKDKLRQFLMNPSLIYLLLLGISMLKINCLWSDVQRYQNAKQIDLARLSEQKALERGKKIWFDPNIGTIKRNCESCHPKGHLTNAETYPRYKHVLNTMATLSMTHNFAVVNESKGNAWELGSEDANTLALFVKSLANGKKIRMAQPNKFKNEWINRGKSAFKSLKLSTTEQTCESCHLKGGKKHGFYDGKMRIPNLKGVAATYPKYSFKLNRIITLEQQINYCIKKHLNGNPLPLNDETIVALCCYLTSLSEGKKVSVARFDR